MVGENIDTTHKNAQKIVNFQRLKALEKSQKYVIFNTPQNELYLKMLSQNCQ